MEKRFSTTCFSESQSSEMRRSSGKSGRSASPGTISKRPPSFSTLLMAWRQVLALFPFRSNAPRSTIASSPSLKNVKPKSCATGRKEAEI